jgi:hypothetical protein
MLRAVADDGSKTSPMSEFSYLKLGVNFYPHAPYEDLSPGVEGSATQWGARETWLVCKNLL